MSPSTRLILVWFALLKRVTASREKLSSSCPIAARAPVKPPMTAIVAEHECAGGFAWTAPFALAWRPAKSASATTAAADNANVPRFICPPGSRLSALVKITYRRTKMQDHSASTGTRSVGLPPGTLEQAQVPVHHGVDSGLVPALDRVDRLFVHTNSFRGGNRTLHPRGSCDLQLPSEQGHQGNDYGIPRRTRHLAMESVVELGDTRPIVESLALPLDDPAHRREILGCGVARRQLCDHGLDRTPRFEHCWDLSHPRLHLLEQRLRNRLRDDKGPTSRSRSYLDDPGLRKHLECLPQRRPAHFQSLGQQPLRRQAVATVKLSRPNRLGNLTHDRLERPPGPDWMEALDAHTETLTRRRAPRRSSAAAASERGRSLVDPPRITPCPGTS